GRERGVHAGQRRRDEVVVEEEVEQLVVAEHAADRQRAVVGVRVLFYRDRGDVATHRRTGEVDPVGGADDPVEQLGQLVGVLDADRDVVVVLGVAGGRPRVPVGEQERPQRVVVHGQLQV